MQLVKAPGLSRRAASAWCSRRPCRAHSTALTSSETTSSSEREHCAPRVAAVRRRSANDPEASPDALPSSREWGEREEKWHTHRGPLVKPEVQQLLEQARDGVALTQEQTKLLVHGIPRVMRQQLKPKAVEAAMDAGALDRSVLFLAHTNIIDLNNAVLEMSSRGQIRKALRLVKAMIHNFKANKHTTAMFFKGCNRHGDMRVALHCWSRWAQMGLMGSVSATALVNGVMAWDTDAAVDVFFELTWHGVPIHRRCYHAILKHLGCSRMFAEAQDVYQAMKELGSTTPDSRPDVVTYQLMLDAACKVQRWGYAETLFRDMQKAGVEPDGPLSATFMKAFGYAGDFTRVRQIHEHGLRLWQVPPDRWHFNALMICAARRGDLRETLGLLRDMHQAQVEPDSYTFVTLFTAVARNYDATVKDIDFVLQVMSECGLEHNTYTSAALLQAYRNCAGLSSATKILRAEEQLSSMKRLGIAINAEVTNTLIALFWECDAIERAEEMYEEMVELGIVPSANTYSIMIMMCTEDGRLAEAEAFKNLRDAMTHVLGVTETNTGSGRSVPGL